MYCKINTTQTHTLFKAEEIRYGRVALFGRQRTSLLSIPGSLGKGFREVENLMTLIKRMTLILCF